VKVKEYATPIYYRWKVEIKARQSFCGREGGRRAAGSREVRGESGDTHPKSEIFTLSPLSALRHQKIQKAKVKVP